MHAKFLFSTLVVCFFSASIFGQNGSIRGRLLDNDGTAVAFSNVALFREADSVLVKVAAASDAGDFELTGLAADRFFLKSSFVGLPDFLKKGIELAAGKSLDLGDLRFSAPSAEMSEVVVSTTRPILEVRADRTVFNVQGTINATGADGLSLLRKAPAVLVDNQDNVSVLGRSGVLIYVDGKRLPLAGADLSAFLKNLTAEQIDRIEIITSPGAKYDAQGNAGIIDIRLKKDKNLGANGALGTTFSQGKFHQFNSNASGNYRNRRANIFGAANYGDSKNYSNIDFRSVQNGLFLDELLETEQNGDDGSFRLGIDFFLSKKHTLGFLISAGGNSSTGDMFDQIGIAQNSNRTKIDSVLRATTRSLNDRSNRSGNLNYRFENGKSRSLNVDFDAANYFNDATRGQTNRYFSPTDAPLSATLTAFEQPTEIGILTAKADFEDKAFGGTLGLGAKFSRVLSDNDFLVFDVITDVQEPYQKRDDARSNLFNYDEKVAAAYASFARPIDQKWAFSAGLRAEKTDATGDLKAFRPDLQEPPVVLDYLSFFPSAGVTFQAKADQSQAWSLGFSRRINRPDYHVLNPFNNQLSEISFEKGNPFLRPEIVNNAELGLTWKYRFSFKLGYSLTTDQITRLIGPDEIDPRSNYISWENLAEQRVLAFNVSAPFEVTKWWDFYLNASASRQHNLADYGDGATVDVAIFSYNFYQQSTFKLGRGWRGEVSGWYSGPGVWGGVFLYEPSWSLDLGLQKKFFKEKLSLRLSASDVFFQSFWSGFSEFDGLYSEGGGSWDARRGTVSLNYNFGNQNVKSRKRKTGLEEEAKRVGGGN